MKVYVLHRYVEYETGYVIGVFLTKQAAIDHAMTMVDKAGELSVTMYKAADRVDDMAKEKVWAMLDGVICESKR